MKALSIILLMITVIYAAITADATAFVVAFLFFSHTYGKDVVEYWEELLSK